MATGLIHSTESFGAADGAGVRFVIFLKGCNLRCRYCHNPDTWAEKNTYKKMSANEVITNALRYKEYWGKYGGITVSGGEPLLQIDFLLELFKQAKSKKINTCIDTSGQSFTKEKNWLKKFDKLMNLTDTVLLDLKQIDETKHIKLTGKTNKNILEMFDYLSSINKKTWARYVLVPGYTDDVKDVEKASSFLRSHKNIERIDVLPYHTLGVHKWKACGLKYSLNNVKPPSEDLINRVKKQFGCID